MVRKCLVGKKIDTMDPNYFFDRFFPEYSHSINEEMATMAFTMERPVVADNTKFEELCRLCGTRASVVISYNIFEGEGSIRQIGKKIETCLQIQVHHQDELPKLICESCFYKLEIFWEFRVRSLKTEELLIELCKQVKSTANSLHLNEHCVVDPAGGLIIVPNHQLLEDNLSNDMQIDNLSERNEALIHQEIILQHTSDLHHGSLDSLNLNGHALGQDLSNQSLSSLPGTEPVLVSESERLTQDNFNLMQQQQFILNEQFRLHHELQVNLTDENALSGYRLSDLKDNLSHIDSHNYQNQEKTDNNHSISTITYPKNALTVSSNLHDESLGPEVNSHLNNIITYSSDSQLENLRHDDNSESSNLLNDEEIHRVINKGGYLLSHDDGDTQDSSILGLNQQQYFACTLCGKSFDNKPAFEIHYETHYFKCDNCLLAFESAEVLQAHKNSCSQQPLTEEDQNSNESGKLAIVEDDSSVDISVNSVSDSSINLKEEIKIEEDLSNQTPEEKASEEVVDGFDDFDDRSLTGSPKEPSDGNPTAKDVDSNISTDESTDCKLDIYDEVLKTEPIENKKFELSTCNDLDTDRIYKRNKEKPTICIFCSKTVKRHLSRHIFRHHHDQDDVKKIIKLSPKSKERNRLITAIRRKGYFQDSLNKITLNPVRSTNNSTNKYLCQYCLGQFSRQYLSKHISKCPEKPKDILKPEKNCLSKSQTFMASVISQNANFLDKSRVKKYVLDAMRADAISEVAKTDPLVCLYGEHMLENAKKNPRAVSIKMRELARLIIALRSTGTRVDCIFEVLKPSMFSKLITATKIICGYDESNKSFKIPSLALHMGTQLKALCSIALKLVVEKHKIPKVNYDCALNARAEIKEILNLIEKQWSTEFAVAINLFNKHSLENLKALPQPTDILEFQRYITELSESFCENIQKNINLEENYKTLTECVLAQSVIFNREHIMDVQNLTIECYTKNHEIFSNENADCLTEVEKILSESFKKVFVEKKDNKSVVLLFNEKMQRYITCLLNIRNNMVPMTNPYLFADPGFLNQCMSASNVLKKLIEKSGTSDLLLLSRFRKYIGTTLQLMSLKPKDLEEVAKLLGHTETTVSDIYGLPEDIHQATKVSKILLKSDFLAKHTEENEPQKTCSVIDFTDVTPETKENEKHNDINGTDETEIIQEINDLQKNCIVADVTQEIREKIQQRSADDKDSNVRRHSKRDEKSTICILCHKNVKMNFARHLLRHHKNHKVIKKIVALPPKSKKRINLISVLRKRGYLQIKLERKKLNHACTSKNAGNEYSECQYCFGNYTKRYLNRHLKICSNKQEGLPDISESQTVSFPSQNDHLVNLVTKKKKNKNETYERENIHTKSNQISRNRVRNLQKPRHTWSVDEKRLISDYFKQHIKSKIVPKKGECEAFIQKYENDLFCTDWVKIKLLVYNIYRKLHD